MRWFFINVIGLTLLATIILSAPSSENKCLPDGPGLTIEEFLSGQFYLFERQQAFSIKLLQTAVAASPKQNLIFSPHSIYTALLITYFLSADQTEAELKKFLNLPPEQDKLKVLQAYRMEKLFQTMRAQNTSSDYEFSSTDRLFVSKRLPLQKCVGEVFAQEVHPMDFVIDPELARMYINNWVTNQTNGHIKDLIPSGNINYNTRLVLTNAAYFKGLWSSQFASESTKEEVFYISPTENAKVPMMWQSGTFNLLSSDELGAHVLELPYKGGDISLFVILPPFNKQRGISLLTKRLNTNILQEIVSSNDWRTRNVEVSLPKFSIEQTMGNLVPLLEQMGIGELFKGRADLSTLTGGANGVTVDEAVHKAKISVDEEGTIAAAATAIISSRSSRPLEPYKFRANHPFVYFLFDKITGSVLFMGVYNSPNNN
ncbi:serine protease inhibitor 88Ea-like [Daktulosphaira vitifoliae]|uniref:serine protease inhibitor 88Ea-like n=1 Tax=Daktulosphaira vitifoliae TaxID=58002 RepID=UPI0021A99577|nr:serine protease inhibitor 88Ea-like [Daktulosphaira vitifoliae]